MQPTAESSEEHKRALRIKVRQVDTLYENSPLALMGGAMVLMVGGYLLQSGFGGTRLYAWGGVMAAIYAIRFLSFLAYRQAPKRSRIERKWSLFFFIGTAAAGLGWGVAPLLLVDRGSVTSHAILLTIIAGLTAGAALSHAAVRWAGAIFLVPAVLPAAGLFIWLGDRAHVGMGVIAAVFVLGMLLLMERLHQNLRKGFEAALDNALLVRKTHDARNRAQILNDQLKAALEEHARTEGHLRQSEERLKNAQRIAGFGHWEWDILKKEISWSDQLFRIFGVVPDGTEVTFERFLDRVHPEERARVEAAIKSALEERTRYSIDYRILWSDDSVHVVHDEAEVTFDKRNRAVKMAGVINDITRRSETEARIRRSERELARILDNMQDTYFRTSPSGTIVRISSSVERMLGYTPPEVIGTPLDQLYANGHQRDAFMMELNRRNGAVWNYELEMVKRSGVRVWVAINAHLVYDRAGEVSGVEGTARDITELKQAVEALHRSQQRALVTLASIGDGVITTDAGGRVGYMNPVAERLIGVEGEAAEGRHYLELFTLADTTTGEPLGDLVAACVADGLGLTQVEQGTLHRGEGGDATMNITVAPMREQDGTLSGTVLVLHDITALLGMAQQISFQASHDLLTGLPNRYGLESRVEKVLHGGFGDSHTLYYLDLDQLKVVNDTCGHHAGDELLKQIAARLRDQIRREDLLARIGGDEFAVLIEGQSGEEVGLTAERLRDAVREFRFVWQGKSFDNGVSIGVVPFLSTEGMTAAEVMSAAESTCFMAKEGGRNRIQVQRPEDGVLKRHQSEMEWVHRINAALEDERLTLYLQPIVPLDPEDGSLPHFEVLMRMLSLEGKVIPPGAYIPAAERYRLMTTLDRWVVRATLERLQALQGNAERAPVVVGVNLSGQSLADTDFLGFILSQFDEFGVAYENVIFEVTETAAIGNLNLARNLITELRSRGCGFALDDFGAGLSSFGYLKNLPVDYLKIDGAFVRDMVKDRTDRAMVAAIHQVGAVIGTKTIAEFVDSEASVRMLRDIGVDFAQGYFLGPPAPWQEALKRVGPTARARAREVVAGATPSVA